MDERSSTFHRPLLTAGSQEVVQVLDNVKIHRPERKIRDNTFEELKKTKSLMVLKSVFLHTHLDIAQMKSMDTAHLYLGASSWSS